MTPRVWAYQEPGYEARGLLSPATYPVPSSNIHDSALCQTVSFNGRIMCWKFVVRYVIIRYRMLLLARSGFFLEL